MKTILVDDELWAIEQFEIECGNNPDIEVVGRFNSSAEALEYAQNNKVDFALLDVEMPGVNGIELGKKLREIYPNMIVVFVTGYEDYVVDAMKMKADYYLFKPYNKEDVEEVIYRAKLLSARFQKKVFIRTFGSFDVFVDDKPVVFASAKAKELLAILVERKGGILTNEEGFSYLWENEPYDHERGSAYRKVVGRLHDTLTINGIDDIVVRVNNGRYVNTSAFDCDYYQYLNGDKKAINLFNGEYMSNYSWGEYTLAKLWTMWK